METKPQKSSAEAKQTPENFVKDIRRTSLTLKQFFVNNFSLQAFF